MSSSPWLSQVLFEAASRSWPECRSQKAPYFQHPGSAHCFLDSIGDFGHGTKRLLGRVLVWIFCLFQDWRVHKAACKDIPLVYLSIPKVCESRGRFVRNEKSGASHKMVLSQAHPKKGIPILGRTLKWKLILFTPLSRGMLAKLRTLLRSPPPTYTRTQRQTPEQHIKKREVHTT